MDTTRIVGALGAIALSTMLGGCAWMFSGGQYASGPRTAPVEITNMSSMTVCSVKIWRDKPKSFDPPADRNLLEQAVSTPMGIEVKVIPIQPGDSQYFRFEAPGTYHTKVMPCGGAEQTGEDLVVSQGGTKWVLD